MEANLNVDEKSIFELEPSEITVNKELGRQRKDVGEIQKMVESLEKFGQMQPVVINRNNELIAGGRRLAACLISGRKVRVCYKDTVDPLLMREMELEENIQRKALTPAEEALAVDELVKLKQKIYGVKTQNKEGGFSQGDAAELLGMSRTSVVENIKVAEILKMFPELSECKTKNDIKKAAKGLERVQSQINALASYEATIKKSEKFILVNREATDYLRGIGSESVDLFFSDPPYGIDIHENAMTLGGETGGEVTTTGTEYEDKFEKVKPLLERIVKESFRITKSTGHAYLFCGRDRFIFQFMYDEMVKAGWDVLKWPIVWIKRGTGQNNQPDRWPSSAYEAILFARKVNSRIVLPGRPDWIQCDPVLDSIRVHQAEKPVELCKELIARVCIPGQYILDCCMGSGAVVEAAVDMKMFSLGCENNIASYASAVARMTKWSKSNE